MQCMFILPASFWLQAWMCAYSFNTFQVAKPVSAICVCSVMHKSETVLTMQRNKLRVMQPPPVHCNTNPAHPNALITCIGQTLLTCLSVHSLVHTYLPTCMHLVMYIFCSWCVGYVICWRLQCMLLYICPSSCAGTRGLWWGHSYIEICGNFSWKACQPTNSHRARGVSAHQAIVSWIVHARVKQ